MKKIIIEFLIIFTVIFLLFIYNEQIKENIIIIFFQFLGNVIPSLFPIILISNYIKYRIINNTNNKYIKFISLCLSFTPSNAFIASTNKEILYSTVINPLFSFMIFKKFWSINKSIIVIIINMMINYILLYKNITINKTDNIKNKNFVDLLKYSTSSLINIFGVIIFFNIIISLLSIFINPIYLFFIEITNGFNIIGNINNSIFKDILLIFLNSFGGLSIFFQIKSINNDAKYLLIIKKLIISLFITLITIITFL